MPLQHPERLLSPSLPTTSNPVSPAQMRTHSWTNRVWCRAARPLATKNKAMAITGGSLLAVRGEWPYPTSCERSRTTQPTCSGTLGCGASCRTWMISSDNAKSHPRHQSLDSNVRFSHRRKGPGIGSLETASGRNRGPTGSDNLFTAPFRGHSVRSQLTIPHRVYHQFRDGHPGCGQALRWSTTWTRTSRKI